ncbi:alginate O-acetyltransferase AlgF [Shimia sp.]|uniref:alginate O-acetyltransferase AlgF n=1 Tax=Shimia sp. TaxID=1954381 RepID=UPI003BA864E5
MTRMFLTAPVAAAIVLSQASILQAADDNLYQDVFAPNSSFIRVLAPDQSVATVGSKSLEGLSDGPTEFVNVMPGEVTVSLTGASATVQVEPNMHYTIVSHSDDQATVQIDTITGSPSKADVTFYNMSDADNLELYVPAAKASVLTGVNAANGKSIAIKAPLTLDFEVRREGEVLATATQVQLQRKAGVTIVFAENDGGYSALATPNAYLK